MKKRMSIPVRDRCSRATEHIGHESQHKWLLKKDLVPFKKEYRCFFCDALKEVFISPKQPEATNEQ